MLNVVVFNGGRGASSLISSLLMQKGINLTSVVNAYDDGKSTGEIRRFFNMLGPSDIRKVQELMLRNDDPDFEACKLLFNYRFPSEVDFQVAKQSLDALAKGDSNPLFSLTFQNSKLWMALRSCLLEFLQGLKNIEMFANQRFNFSDCSIMNCIYAGAFLLFDRNLEKTTLFFDRLFQLKGSVLPINNENKKLVALRENGEMLYSEAEIVELRSNVKIEQIYLLDHLLDKNSFDVLSLEAKRYYLARHHSYVDLSMAVKLALKQADIIIYAAGTQHSSLYPTYITRGLAEEIANNRDALKVLITNIGADYETPSYQASDYIKSAYRYLNIASERHHNMSELMDYALVNDSHSYETHDGYIKLDHENLAMLTIPLIQDQFESYDDPGKHDGKKLVSSILQLYEVKFHQAFLA